MFSFILSLCVMAMIASCHEKEVTKPVVPGGEADVTVIVYMAAENSLSDYAASSYYSADLNEMVRGAKHIPVGSRLVVYVDDKELPRIYTISAQEGLTLEKALVEHNSADAPNFERNIRQIISDYPADKYALVMWSHGSGWIPQKTEQTNAQVPSKPNNTFGVDNNLGLGTGDRGSNVGSEMNIADMRQALDNIGVHWQYIFFDACFMQCVEVAYELHHLTDYIIGSPAEIPGDGAPYDAIMPYMMNPTEYNIQSLIEVYFNSYIHQDGSVLSAVRTSELDSMLNLTRQLLPDFYTESYNLDCSDIQPYCAYQYNSYWKPEYYDIGSVMNHMLNQGDYTEWFQQLERTVFIRRNTSRWLSIYENYYFRPITIDPDHLALMSIFVPNEKYDQNTNYNQDIQNTAWYKDFVNQR